MTARHSGYVVVLSDDIREDEAQAVLSALSMVRGVISVKPVPADSSMLIAQTRERHQIAHKILNLYEEVMK